MATLGSLIQSIDEAFERDGSICLWFSGGSDSRLLLEIMLKTGKPFGILLFQDGWTTEQKRFADEIIKTHNLQTFHYPAINHLLVTENGEISLISGYAIDARSSLSVIIRDLVDEPNRCLFDVKLEKPRMLAAPTEFDTHILGTRGDDRHWIFEGAGLAQGYEWKRGEKTFLAPLWDWSQDAVRYCLKAGFDIEVSGPDTGDVRACSKCLTEAEPFCPKAGEVIKPHEWQPVENLKIARKWLVR